tara:strand:- start:10224 stop:11063 length:840 start_codon:yes stop_codon:yes gene_type:complete
MASKEIVDKTLLITGGAGSLGKALTLELLKHSPQSIRIFDNSEFFQWEMQQKYTDPRLRFLIGDIRDKERLSRAMNGADIVIHAAALKHVPLCEYNPIEAVTVNSLGSANVIDCAIDNKAQKVIAISSDKAVHPINIYGATKLVMEKLIVQANVYGDTKFSCVRFGNFEESRGNLVSLVYQQLESGEPITVTDKEMSRFWITLDKVCEFIVQSLEIMKGGEIIIPKMTQKEIMDVISSIAPNALYKVIGRRQGEKLNELLFSEDENPVDCGSYHLIKGA